MNPSQINNCAVQGVRAARVGVGVLGVMAKCAPMFRIKAETETCERLWEQYGMGGGVWKPIMFHDDCRVMKKVFAVAQKTTLYIYIYIINHMLLNKQCSMEYLFKNFYKVH